MKILNLYSGLGGNRVAWNNNHEVIAVESNQQVALIYQKRFPKDTVIIADAIEYFLDNFPYFDMIWLSPPCKSHTKLIKFQIQRKFEKGYDEKLKLPDFSLYEVITFLKHNYKGIWVVENVKPYYTPIIKETVELGRHLFWSNIYIPPKEFKIKEYFNDIKRTAEIKQIDLEFIKQFKSPHFRLDGILRDMVNPKISKYIMDCIVNRRRPKQKKLF